MGKMELFTERKNRVYKQGIGREEIVLGEELLGFNFHNAFY